MRRGVIVWLLVAAACGGSTPADQAEPAPTLEPGRVIDITHDRFEAVLDSFAGRPLVVNYWATWCGPCVEEMPRFVKAAKRFADDVAFLGVDVEDDATAADRFLERFGVPFPSVGDPKGDIKRGEQIVGLPTTQFLRADGELAFVHSGEITEDDLTKRIEELIRIAEPADAPRR